MVLDSEAEAATALAHAKSPEQPPAKGADPEDGDRFDFMPPDDDGAAPVDQSAELLQEGAWMEGPDEQPMQVSASIKHLLKD